MLLDTLYTNWLIKMCRACQNLHAPFEVYIQSLPNIACTGWWLCTSPVYPAYEVIRHPRWLNSNPFSSSSAFSYPSWASQVYPCSLLNIVFPSLQPGRVAQSVGHLTRKSGVLGSIPGLATYFRFSFRFFKKGSCQLLAKVCARSTG